MEIPKIINVYLKFHITSNPMIGYKIVIMKLLIMLIVLRTVALFSSSMFLLIPPTNMIFRENPTPIINRINAMPIRVNSVNAKRI